MPKGGSCRHCSSSDLDEGDGIGLHARSMPLLTSFSWTNCLYISFFPFQFGWKFPFELGLVVVCQYSHDPCLFFAHLISEYFSFSSSFLYPTFHVSPFSMFSMACLSTSSVLLPSIPLPSGNSHASQQCPSSQKLSSQPLLCGSYPVFPRGPTIKLSSSICKLRGKDLSSSPSVLH